MSEPPRCSSSRAAKTGKEALMVFEYPGDRLGFRRRVPLVEFERAAKNDPVRSWEHVSWSAGESILHLLLRFENRELPARGVQILVPEQVAATKASAIEHQPFG